MTIATNRMEPTNERLVAMLERMVLIRRVEEQLGDDSRSGVLPGNVHLYVGQEAVAVGVCEHLADTDLITSTHRAHGHFLAKGGSARALIAEIHGKSTGACKGYGGSMHVADFSKGMLGANAIVGGGIGLSAGAALAVQTRGDGQVCVCFLGDGAAGEGVLYEVMNIAALWKLPLILICEANAYAGISTSGAVTAGQIIDRAAPYGIPCERVDGNDLVAVWRAAGEAVERARCGEGPSFILADTYRLRGHIEIEAGFLVKKYRTDEEIADWALRDPIPRLAASLAETGALAPDAISAIEAKVAAQVADAHAFAIESPAPGAEAAAALLADV